MADDIFTEPDFLQNQSVDEVHQQILGNLPDDIDKSEGGFAWDFTRPTAIEAAQMTEFDLIETLKLIFPQTAYGSWLNLHAGMRGIARKAATKATGTVTVTGTAGTVIPVGYLFSTVSTADAAGIQFATDVAATIGSAGTANIPVTAVDAGTMGNVAAGTISLMVKPMAGIASITNSAVTKSGTDEEADENLYARIKEYDSTQGVSFVGSVADYKRWAMEVDGVGNAKVIPPKATDGTITIILMDATGAAATSDLTTAVYNHIMSPDDRSIRLAPVNALLSVVPPTAVNIDYTANVRLNTGASINDVKAAFETALLTYYSTAANDGQVKYAEIGSLLLATVGVSDYSGLTLNGGTANIAIAESEMPATKSVELTAV